MSDIASIPMECNRCGICCLANMIPQACEEDLERWRLEGRDDILEKYRWTAWAGDRLVALEDGHHLYACPYLMLEEDRAACAIYETRPTVCRDFEPGSSEICPLFRKKTL